MDPGPEVPPAGRTTSRRLSVTSLLGPLFAPRAPQVAPRAPSVPSGSAATGAPIRRRLSLYTPNTRRVSCPAAERQNHSHLVNEDGDADEDDSTEEETEEDMGRTGAWDGCRESDRPRCRVLMLGAPGVGKSSLAAAFTGAGKHADDTGACTRWRTVLVDGEEVMVVVEDTWAEGESVRQASRGMDAFLLVYSVTERSSFERASELRIALRRGADSGGQPGRPLASEGRPLEGVPGQAGASHQPAVILVGNKSDLVRSREVSEEEGRACAAVFDCKFIETSAALSVNVTQLFQGVVRQVRLRSNPTTQRSPAGSTRPRSRSTSTTTTTSSTSSSACRLSRRESLSERARRVLGRIVTAAPSGTTFKSKSRSCHDLSVL